MNKYILCVDFDGVIHSYTSGWKGADVVSDPPVPGAFEWLARATEHWDVCIYSSRSSQPGGIKAMVNWFLLHSKNSAFVANIRFPVDKPAAFLTIDDRAIQFDGDWSKLDSIALLSFVPWNKKPKTD